MRVHFAGARVLKASLTACALAACVPGLGAQEGMEAFLAPASGVPQPKYWLRMYPLQPYAEHWRLHLKVKGLKKTLPRITAALEKNGGSALVPLASAAASPSHHVVQLSFRLPRDSAAKALKALQDLGEVESLNKAPGAYPGILEEARDKLKALRADTSAYAEALGRMPAVSAAASEIEEHLAMIERVHAEAQTRVLLNMEIRE